MIIIFLIVPHHEDVSALAVIITVPFIRCCFIQTGHCFGITLTKLQCKKSALGSLEKGTIQMKIFLSFDMFHIAYFIRV